MILFPEISISDWTQLINHFLLVVIMMSCILLFSLYIISKTNTHSFLKFFLIPFTIIFLFVFMSKIDSILGYAHPSVPKQKVVLLGHKRVGDYVELWIQEIQKPHTKLHRLPYSEELMKKLNKAQKKGGGPNGKQQILEWNPRDGHFLAGDFQSYDFNDLEYFYKKPVND